MSRRHIPTLFDLGDHPIITEAYRLLKTRIRLLQGDKSLKTVLITSSGPGEGKSTVTANLGFSLARDGANVLLVDTDLRFPTLHEIFEIENSSGVTDAFRKIYSMEVASGTLDKQGMGDLLQSIRFQEKTGWLDVEEGKQSFHFSFKRGKITDVFWDNRPVEKRLGAMLVKERKITKNQLTQALEGQENGSKALGYTLTQLGYIDSQALEPILRSHFTENLHKVFELKGARFTFNKSESSSSKIRYLNHSNVGAALSEELKDLIKFDQPFAEEKISSFIKETKFKNIKLMTRGSPTSNSSEVLSSEKMRSIVDILSNKFDFILFDSPPAALSTDASLLGSFLDGVILVVHAGRCSISMIQQAKKELSKVQANIIGVVLNQFDLRRDGYPGYYYQAVDKGGIL